MIAYWNMSVQKWLKYYVYMRFLSSDPNKRGKGTELAALMTFIVSAIWHGFYPGYIVFFFWIFVFDQHEKTARKVVP